MNISNKCSPPQREAIVDKLHVALATFRRERDEVHRSKELSFERLRLSREERMAAETIVQSMQEKYDKMMSSMASPHGNQDDEIKKLQSEAERLSREVRFAGISNQFLDKYYIMLMTRQFVSQILHHKLQAKFQHSELVSKREKLDQLLASMKEEEQNRSGYLRLAREAVRKRREKVALQESNKDSDIRKESDDIEIIKKCLISSGEDLLLYSKLQRLIEKNASDIENEIDEYDRKSKVIMKRIQGYNQLIKGEGNIMGNHNIQLIRMDQ